MGAMSQLLDQKLEHLATKEDVQKELQMVREENKCLKATIQQISEQGRELQVRVERLENLNRRNNLIFTGIPNRTSNVIHNVTKFCEEMLEVSNTNIIRANFLGPPSRNIILVELPSSTEVSSILLKGKCLKGTKMTINRDYSMEMRAKRSILFRAKKVLHNIKKQANIQVRGATLYVEGMRFRQKNNSILPDEEPDLQKLDILFGENISNLFLDVNNFKSKNNVNINE